MTDSSDTIYIRLLAEGIDVYRPVLARRESATAYYILDQDVPEDETWEFQPGTTVQVHQKRLSEGDCLVAVLVAVALPN